MKLLFISWNNRTVPPFAAWTKKEDLTVSVVFMHSTVRRD
jgi:hypothetical protein